MTTGAGGGRRVGRRPARLVEATWVSGREAAWTTAAGVSPGRPASASRAAMAPCWARPVRTTREASGSARADHGTGAAWGSRSPEATLTVVPRARPAARGAAVAAVTPGVTETETP